MRPVPPQSPADILRAARTLIERPEAWTKCKDARDVFGKSVLPKHPGAVCWCGEGAVLAVSPRAWPGISDCFRRMSVAADVPAGMTFHGWQDDPATTHSMVLAAMSRAIELAEKDAAP